MKKGGVGRNLVSRATERRTKPGKTRRVDVTGGTVAADEDRLTIIGRGMRVERNARGWTERSTLGNVYYNVP